MYEQQTVDPSTAVIVTAVRPASDETFKEENMRRMEPPGYKEAKEAMAKLGADMQNSGKFKALRINPFGQSVDGLTGLSALNRLNATGGMLDARYLNPRDPADVEFKNDMDKVRLRMGDPTKKEAQALGYDVARALPGWVVPGASEATMVFRNLLKQGLPPLETLGVTDEKKGIDTVFKSLLQLDQVLSAAAADGRQPIYALDSEGKALAVLPTEKQDELKKSIQDRITAYQFFVATALSMLGRYKDSQTANGSTTLPDYYNDHMDYFDESFAAQIDQKGQQLISDLNTGTFLKVLGICPFSSQSEAEELLGRGTL